MHSSQWDIDQTFVVEPSRRRPCERVPERGARGLKRGACGLRGGEYRGYGWGRAEDAGDCQGVLADLSDCMCHLTLSIVQMEVMRHLL